MYDGEYPYFAEFLIFVNGYRGGGIVKCVSCIMLKWSKSIPLKKFFSGVSTTCRQLGSGTNQLVTITNHLAGVDLMVPSGWGGCCVLLWGCIVPRYLCPVFCVINLTMVHGDYGKIHAVVRQFRICRLFSTIRPVLVIIFHNQTFASRCGSLSFVCHKSLINL